MHLKQCGHCENDRDMKEIARGTYNEESEFNRQAGFHLERCDVAIVKQCPRCGEITLFTHDDANYYDDDQHTLKVLYPRSRDISALPPVVHAAYKKSQKAKSVDSDYYAIRVRSVLEAVCSDKNATGKDLFVKLNKLIESGLLPSALGGISHYLRLIGNVGAHAGTVEVSNADVEAITDFLDAILEYLYIAPAKLKLVSDDLAARKAADKVDTDQVGT